MFVRGSMLWFGLDTGISGSLAMVTGCGLVFLGL